MKRPLLLGHRGARRAAPENTFAAFDLALAHGCDGFEFDVRCTSDRRGVICHDPKLGHMTVARTAFDKLREREATVPCLSDVLQHYAQRAFLDIEFKVAGAEDELLDALRRWPPQRGFVVSSFLPEILHGLRHRDAELPLGLIADKARALKRWRELDVQYVVAHYSLVTAKLLSEVQREAKKLFVWTINEAHAMRQLAELGADALISDDTELLGHTFQQTERRGTS